MAVQPQTPYREFIANGSTTRFALGFDCEDQQHLIVTIDEVEPAIGTWSLDNGSIVFSAAPASGKEIVIQRNMPFERERDYQLYDNSFRPPAVNRDFDRIWWKLQELNVADFLLDTALNKEKLERIYGDEQLKGEILANFKFLKSYIDQIIALITNDPSFSGISTNMVFEGEKSQELINQLQLTLNEDLILFKESLLNNLTAKRQTKDSFKNAYSSKLTNRFNRVKNLCSVGRSYIWKNPKYNNDPAYRFSLGLNMNGYNTIEWDFIADIDDFWRMRYGFAGPIRAPKNFVDASNLSKDPVRVGDNAYFRSSDGLNSTFDIVFQGTGLLFNHYVDANGGVFRVTIDGVDYGTISTNAANPENSNVVASNISKLVATNLQNTTHTATFIFIGDDPAHTPASGVSRGWFKYEDGNPPEAHTAYIITGSEMGIATTGTSLVSNGILEFAIGAAVTESGMMPDWVPAHGSATGCIVVTERKIFIDGVQSTGISATEKDFSEFTLHQEYTAYNSADTEKQFPMWTGTLYTKFDRNHGLTYSHEFTTLRELSVSDGYTAMTSGRRTSDLNKITFDNGVIIDISGKTPELQIVHRPGIFKSVAWTGSKTALALNIENFEASTALGEGFNDGVSSIATERPDGFCKVYAKPLGTNKIVPAGVTISSTHSIWLATF